MGLKVPGHVVCKCVEAPTLRTGISPNMMSIEESLGQLVFKFGRASDKSELMILFMKLKMMRNKINHILSTNLTNIIAL
jgi:hypothetical protein